jgi:hypothetical protein
VSDAVFTHYFRCVCGRQHSLETGGGLYCSCDALHEFSSPSVRITQRWHCAENAACGELEIRRYDASEK